MFIQNATAFSDYVSQSYWHELEGSFDGTQRWSGASGEEPLPL